MIRRRLARYRTGVRLVPAAIVGGSILLAAADSAQANCYRLLKPNGWQYETVCNNGGGGGGGGGGGNAAGVAAGLAAGALFLGALGEMAHQQEQNQAAADAEAARAAAARQAYCQQNWQQASQRINIGNDLVKHNRPGEAIPHYQTAAELLSRCGDSQNVGVARRNLAEAQRQYAAVKPDNRIEDATARYAANNPYASSTNPFQRGGADSAAATGPKIAFDKVHAQAQQKCRSVEKDRERWKTCMETQAARAIMEADSEIKAACGLQSNAAARNKCALEAYAAQIASRNSTASAEQQDCYYDKSYQKCVPTGGTAAGRAKNGSKTSLRDEMKKKLADAKRLKGDPSPVTEEEVTAALGGETPAKDTANTAPPAIPMADDDPLRLYMGGTSAATRQSGISARNDGALGTAPATTDRALSYEDRFGIDPNQKAEDPTIFDQVRGQYRNQQMRGNVGP